MIAPRRRRRRLNPLHALPLLHLAACLVTAATGVAWMWVTMIDMPVGLVELALAWRYDTALPYFVIGTAWWYFLSWLVLFVVRKSRRRRVAP